MILERCEVCGSKNIQPGKSAVDYLGKVVYGVPITKCNDCGEELLDSLVLEKVSKLAEKGIDKYLELPIVKIKYGGCVNGKAQ